MKALRVYAPYDYRVEEIDVPEIGDNEILVKSVDAVSAPGM